MHERSQTCKMSADESEALEDVSKLDTASRKQENEGLELKRGYVLQELVSSEETYYRRLQLTFDLYIQPLRRLDILSSAEINLQFYSWDLLVGLHKDLWENMVRDRDAGTLHNIGARFKLFSHFLKCYSQYLASFDRARVERARLLTNNKKFAAFVERVENLPESQHLSLESFLMEPVQRVPRYRLLFEQLLKYTPEGHPDRTVTAEALALTADVAQANNDAIIMRANKDKMMAIMMSLSPTTRINLLDDPSRELLKESTLLRQCRRGIKEFQFWLFSDKLLYADLVQGLGGSSYSLNRDISLTACRVRSLSQGKAGKEEDVDDLSDLLNASTDADPEDASIDTSIVTVSCSSKHSSLGFTASMRGSATERDSFSKGSSSKGSSFKGPGRRGTWQCESSLGAIKESFFFLNNSSAISREDSLTGDRTFIVESPQKSFQVWASSESDKIAWIAAINAAIAEQRKKIGEAGEEIAPLWTPDTAVTHCQNCQVRFSILTRKHHCRSCGCNVCDRCSRNRCTLSHVDSSKDVRVCNTCFLGISNQGSEATGPKEWMLDNAQKSCTKCKKDFGVLTRRHHCRGCGKLFCGSCSSRRAVIKNVDEGTGPLRVCELCYWNLTLGDSEEVGEK